MLTLHTDPCRSGLCFPGSIVAHMIGIEAYPFFQAEEPTRNKISAADALKEPLNNSASTACHPARSRRIHAVC